MKRFEGKTVIVTGAGSGIGAACAKRLLMEGAFVVGVDLKKDDVENTIVGLDAERTLALSADVSNRLQVNAAVAEAVDRFGNLHGLVNSAGVRGVGTLLNTEEENWEHVLSINLDGTFLMCQTFAREVHKRGGKGAIVNIASAAGIVGLPNRLGYVASKFGVVGATRAMCMDVAPLGIRVNAIAPGMIRTPMTAGMFLTSENESKIRAAHPIGREGTAEEVASVAAFLLSEEASFVAGIVMPVDGGYTAGIPSY